MIAGLMRWLALQQEKIHVTARFMPISEARARLTELAEDVVGSGAEKVLTKNGSS